uniref:Transposase domain-containing protein n=1 Tax=Mycena chlorophos TaxID=658473 RepID=A0ABQ0M464_MYCCL|nr:predicted protein [Mycena chlorophos]
MAKLMCMKGPNGLCPCRTCKIIGIRAREGGNNTHYVPYFWDSEPYNPFNLLLRTHDEFIADALAVESAPSKAEAERRAKETGINGLPILASLSSLKFPHSFGHDLMHLISENVIKNLLSFWIGEYKGLDAGVEEYELAPEVVEEIGKECAVAGDTTPAAFGARIPNIATKRHYFTAKSYTLWTTMLAPVLLRGRFSHPKYYRHFLKLVNIFNDCLSMSLERDYVDRDLCRQIAVWVQEYKMYYYQYEDARLSTCPLTIHALLHIPDDILNGGPMWCYWNYVTECYVGFLVRSSKSRRNPYASFARRLHELTQNTAIKILTFVFCGHEQPGLYPTLFGKLLANIYRTRITSLPTSQWQQFPRRLSTGVGSLSSAVGTRCAVLRSPDVDINAHHSRQPRKDERQAAYGQLLELLEFIVVLPESDINKPLLLASIRPVKVPKRSPYPFPVYQDGKFNPIEVVDADDLSCLVARIPANRAGPRVYALYERPGAMGASVGAAPNTE